MSRWFDNTHPGLRQFWHPIATLKDLDGPGPHPARLLGGNYALYQTSGHWQLVPDRCPHRLAPLTMGSIVQDRLQCAYHGWCFDDAGTCVAIPALGEDAVVPPTAHLSPAAQVEERYGLIWASLDEPVEPIPHVPDWDAPRYGHAVLPAAPWNASAAQIADNFLDVAHFPFTHLGTIGDPNDLEVAPYSVERDGWSFTAVHKHWSKVLNDATGDGTDQAFTTFHRTMTFTCNAPHHVQLHIDYGDDGDLLLLFFHQPVDADTTIVYCLMLAENIADGRMTPDDHIAFQTNVAIEDKTLLETLAVKAVPLDAGVETHTRADRITVELRRMLADIDELKTSR